MHREQPPHRLNRRTVVLTGIAVALVTRTVRAGEVAQSLAPAGVALERSELFKTALATALGGTTPIEEGIRIDLPEVAENGNFVPVTIAIESPMTDADHIRVIHLLSTANPVAEVARFHLSPLNGVARVQSRMRLAKTQDVVVVAERSDGSRLMATLLVKVTIGGCSS